MQRPLIDRIPFTRITTILAITIGVSVGLCGIGLDAARSRSDHSTLLGSVGRYAIPIGVTAFWACILCLILTFVVWLALTIIGSFRGRS